MLLIWEVETLAEYILQVKDLHFWYGEIHALKGISLNVEKNGVVSLLGANGAGKTTTLQYISGLIKGKHAGEIWYMGQRIDGKSAHTLSKIGIAQCIEGRRIFSQLSVRENLMMGAYLCRDNAKIKRNLEYVFTLFPRLLEREKQMGGTLSGGEQQMLAVGRALMQDPKLLMMDEPSLGLAPLLIEEVFRAIKKIKEDGLPILLVEQNSKAALQVADRGYVLEVGELVLEDTAENLLHNEARNEDATTGGGHDGSDNFLIGYGNYDEAHPDYGDSRPIFAFADGVARTIQSCYINSTCYFLSVAAKGNALAPALEEGQDVLIHATGYDAAGKETGTVTMTFASKDKLIKEWTKWDLSSLGKVAKVRFNMTGGPDNGYGFSMPAYYALDDITIEL